MMCDKGGNTLAPKGIIYIGLADLPATPLARRKHLVVVFNIASADAEMDPIAYC